MKDIDKFKNSIVIVATRVNNQYVKRVRSFTLVENSKILGTIADFLQEIKQDLGKSVKTSFFKNLTAIYYIYNFSIN